MSSKLFTNQLIFVKYKRNYYLSLILLKISLDLILIKVLMSNKYTKTPMGLFKIDKKVSESIQKYFGLTNYQMQWFVFIFGLICGMLLVLIF